VDLIAAEDTRTTRKLLGRYEISTPMTSFHEHSGRAKQERILDVLAEKDVALVSEAGMPGISDPGYPLIREAIAQGVPVVPVPGPTAVVTALAVSGLPTESFVYLGFLPRRRKDRLRLLRSVAALSHSLVVFEAPHRLLAALADLREVLGDRPIAVAQELTKLYESVWRGSIAGALAHFQAESPRGEFTLVIGGAAVEEEIWGRQEMVEALDRLRRQAAADKDALRDLATLSGWSRRQVYQLLLEMKEKDNDRSR